MLGFNVAFPASLQTMVSLAPLDIAVVAGYILSLIGLSALLGRQQKSGRDHHLGGGNFSSLPIALSTMATQCSTNSILGAPAFVAFTVGGGLLWLQYELAVPLAMAFLLFAIAPSLRRMNLVSIYEYLERRFGSNLRLVLSTLFQFLRAFSTGVTVYGISIVLSHLLGIDYVWAVVLLGVVTVIYDGLGGMKAVIWSDVLQLGVLLASIFFVLWAALQGLGGVDTALERVPDGRLLALDFSGHGFGDGATFAFWPMVFGGFFLYVAYYGCDQSQIQRELSSKSVEHTQHSLFLGGLLRFPLVLTYCGLGVVMAAHVAMHPEFLDLLPLREDGSANVNLAVPIFVFENLGPGWVGLFVAGLFAAAMSSLDSTLNSLSAVTLEDVVKRYRPNLEGRQELWMSRAITLFWGTLCVLFSFFVANISGTIIESINKIGSLINGPVLAVFLLGLFTKRCSELGAIVGLACGFLLNLGLWHFAPEFSWLWWNVLGCLTTIMVGLTLPPNRREIDPEALSRPSLEWKRGLGLRAIALVAYFVVMCLLLSQFQ